MPKITPELLKTSVCIAISEEDECKAIAINLPERYVASNCHTLADLLDTIINKQPDIVLCHEDLIRDQQISLISAIKEASPRYANFSIGRWPNY